MKGKSILGLLLAAIILSGGLARAQAAPPTRATPCSATTAWNAVCLSFAVPVKFSDGVDIPAGTSIAYRAEERASLTAGEWATIPHTVAAPGALLVSSLSSGVHYFRVFASASGGESAPSNVANKGVTTGIPAAPVITIAVVISPDNDPVVVNLSAFADRSVTCEVRPS